MDVSKLLGEGEKAKTVTINGPPSLNQLWGGAKRHQGKRGEKTIARRRTQEKSLREGNRFWRKHWTKMRSRSATNPTERKNVCLGRREKAKKASRMPKIASKRKPYGFDMPQEGANRETSPKRKRKEQSGTKEMPRDQKNRWESSSKPSKTQSPVPEGQRKAKKNSLGREKSKGKRKKKLKILGW